VFIQEGRGELLGNSPVSSGSLIEKTEPIGVKTRITSTGPERSLLVQIWGSSKSVVGKELMKMGE
jgi:hypothetical protein